MGGAFDGHVNSAIASYIGEFNSVLGPAYFIH